MYNYYHNNYTFIKGDNMEKTFDKLNMNLKVEILSELNLLYDLTTERGENALKKEFKNVEPQIKEVMIEKGLYKEE